MSASSSGLLHLLQERGFVHQCTDAAGLGVALGAGPLTAYLGFDATADSLHVGHLQGLMLMRWLQRAGHRPLMLVGGATTRIGDPSFRDTSRPLLDADRIAANIAGIRTAFSRYLGADVAVADNADWLDGLGYLDFLGSVGRHFSVNRMLSFDAIRTRLAHSLSFLEFGYTLLQAYDFVELARRHDCRLLVGGADQWANIINGGSRTGRFAWRGAAPGGGRRIAARWRRGQRCGCPAVARVARLAAQRRPQAPRAHRGNRRVGRPV